MADADRILRLLLQIQADTQGLSSVKGELAGIAEQTQQQNAIESQLATIAQTRVELIGAQLSGENEISASLQRELSVRSAILGAMRAQSLNTAELATLGATEEKLLASAAVASEGVAAGGLLASVNINKARNEALVLGREIATGSISARTMGAFLGSFGSTLTIAGLAGYALYSVVSKVGAETVKLNEDTAKEAEQLGEMVPEWEQLAQGAQKFADVVNLGAKGVAELKKLSDDLSAAQKQQLGVIDQIADALAKTSVPRGVGAGALPLNGIQPNDTTGPQAQARADALKQKQDLINAALRDTVALEKAASDEVARFTAAQADPAKYLGEYNAQLDQAKAKLAAIDPSKSVADHAAYVAAEKDVETVSDKVQKLTEEEKKHSDSIKKSKDETALLNAEASGNPEAAIAEKVRQKYDEVYKAKKAAFSSDAEAAQWAQRESQALQSQLEHQLAIKGAAAGTKAEHQDILAYLRGESTVIQGLRQQQELINSAPFLSVDQKNVITLQSMAREIAVLNAEIAQGKSILAHGDLDPQTWEQVNQKIQQAVFEVQLLQQKIEAQSNTFRTSLTNWVNGFGTAGAQAANVVEGTLNSALQGTNNLLGGLISGTGDWRQALEGVESQILNVFLTWIEQMALQKAASLLGITSTTSAQVASGAAIATAMAPAAAASSVASYGTAAIVGEVLAVAAIAAIIAALAGGFAEGGIIPGPPSSRDNRLAMVASGEGILTSAAVQRHGGAPFVEALNRGTLPVPHFSLGGTVSGGPERGNSGSSLGGRTVHEHYIVQDERELSERLFTSKAAEKHIIRIVNQSGGALRRKAG